MGKNEQLIKAADRLNTAARNYAEAQERAHKAAAEFRAVREKIMAFGVNPDKLNTEIAILEEAIFA